MSERKIQKPDWLKIKLGNDQIFTRTKKIIETHGLHTICSSGRCPNQGECGSRGTAAFMIGGDICTRSCKFCNTHTGKPLPLDENEPMKIARSIQLMQLSYAVITSVDRDDLPDLGATHWVETIRHVKRLNPDTRIEVLIPDFQGKKELLDQIVETPVDVIGHNMETVSRLTPKIRSAATYKTSLKVLSHIASRGIKTKTGIMVGLSETTNEVLDLMNDVLQTGCSIFTVGQYLQPSKAHIPVHEYISPEIFDFYKKEALDKGFEKVESAPLVRSSYHADK
ncbi:MAG: lipoyl synthase [Candidatus Azobacteroides sp.]|nr:lipoyl synthase [Candidatus Azobacteroides sp.]